jgi:PAS domain S-box-containing protein
MGAAGIERRSTWLLLALTNVPTGVCLLTLAARCPAALPPEETLPWLAWGLFAATGTLLVSGTAAWLLARRFLRVSHQPPASPDEAQRREDQLEAVFASVADGLFVCDEVGIISSVNEAACRMFGYPPDELMGLAVRDLLAGSESLSGVHTGEQKLVDTPLAALGRRKGGERFPVSVGVGKTRVQGTALFALTVQDRSEAVRAEQALRLQALTFTHISDAVVLSDADGRIRDCNPAAEAIFGWKREEILGQPIGLLYGGTDPVGEHIMDPGGAHGCTMTRGGWNEECSFRRADGSRGVCELLAVPLPEAAGMLRLHHDLTRCRQIEQEWQRARETSEAIGRARLAFLTGASHETCTPLHGMLTAVQVLAETELDPGQRRQLNCLRMSAERLRRLLEQVLAYAQLEAGTLGLELVPLALRSLLARTLGPLEQLAEQKNVRLVRRMDEETPDDLVGDPVRLEQVVGLLIGSALETTHQGEVVLAVERVDQDRDGTACRLRFVVEGAETSENACREEPGLALTVCERLVALLGGQLTRTNEQGRGAFQFTLRFPLCCRLASWGSKNGIGIGNEAPRPTSNTQRPEALLVLGDPGEREQLARLLGGWGYRATALNSGQEALDEVVRGLVGGQPASLVLVGDPLPDLGAHELTRSLSKLSGFIGRTVLVRESPQAERDGDPSLPAGVAVLARPVAAEQLAGLLGADRSSLC